MAYGWISIHRKLQDNWLWHESEPFDKRSAWIDLILLANHEDKKFLHGNQLEEVERGSRITSIRKLSERWQWSNSKVKRFLDLLQQDNMIVYKSDSKKTVYTIVNYNTYQDEDVTKRNSNEPLTKHQRNSNEPPTHTNNNENNDNNDNKDIRSTKFDTIIDSWNSLDKNISEIQTINSGTTRHKLLQARINEYGEDKVLLAIRNIDKSNFLKGYQKDWKITFDWFIKPNNFIKVLEGNYNDNTQKTTSQFGNNKPLSDIEEENLRRVREMFGGAD